MNTIKSVAQFKENISICKLSKEHLLSQKIKTIEISEHNPFNLPSPFYLSFTKILAASPRSSKTFNQSNANLKIYT